MFTGNRKTYASLFALVILSAIVPTLIVGWLTLRVSEQSLRNDAEVKLTVANTTAKKQLVDWVETNKNEVVYFTGISGVIDDIRQMADEQNPTQKTIIERNIAADFTRFLNSHRSFFEVFLLHPKTGEVLVSTTPGEEGKLHANQPYFTEGKKHPFVQNVYYSISVQQQTITISAPVHTADGTLLGVLAGQMNLDQLNSVLKQPSGLGSTVKSYAVNSFKMIVAGSQVNQKNQNYNYNQLNTLPVVNGLAGKSGVASYVTFNGTRVVGSYLSIPELDLLVVTEIDEQEIYKPIQSLLIITTATIAVTLAITLIIATYLLRLFLGFIESYRKKLETSNVQLAKTQKDLEAQNKYLGILTHSLEVDKEHIERLLHSLSEGVLAVEESGLIWLCNTAAEQTLGTKKEHLMSKHIDEVFKVYKDHQQIKFMNYTKQENKENNWFEINTDTANKKVLSLMTAPIQVGTLGQSGWVVTFSDVTKEAQLESMKLDFVSMAAHELRTPLTSIRGYSSLLNDELSQTGSDTAKGYISKLKISANNLGDLIENLLNVSRIERNMFEIETQPTELTKIIDTVITALSQQAEIKHITLQFNRPQDTTPLVWADAFRISQVVTNLLANAINYTQENGNISIALQKNEHELQVSVADNGPGIPQDALPKLFTKFFRVSGVLEQGSKGTGLGLYITKSIIEMHHGRIWAESEFGKGATFIFTLPIAEGIDVEKYNNAVASQGYTNTAHRGIIMNNRRRSIQTQQQ